MTFVNSLLQQISRRKSPLWRYAFILTITFFLAKSLNLVIAHYYLPPKLPDTKDIRRTRTPYGSGPRSGVNFEVILDRNIFNSDPGDAPIPTVTDKDKIYPTTLSAELQGTIVFENSEFSVALILDRSKKIVDYFAVGDLILSARIAKINRFEVIVENKGRLERMELKAARDIIKKHAALDPTKPTAPQKVDSELEAIGPNHYIVPQVLVDDALKNFSKILTQARMVPNITSGNKTDGFRIFQIKQDSIYKKLGLKDNDIIKRVNGQYLDSFEKATGLFSALRNENSLTIDVERDGTKLNLKYEIR
jgi:general secretion pathway protein C